MLIHSLLCHAHLQLVMSTFNLSRSPSICHSYLQLVIPDLIGNLKHSPFIFVFCGIVTLF